MASWDNPTSSRRCLIAAAIRSSMVFMEKLWGDVDYNATDDRLSSTSLHCMFYPLERYYDKWLSLRLGIARKGRVRATSCGIRSRIGHLRCRGTYGASKSGIRHRFQRSALSSKLHQPAPKSHVRFQWRKRRDAPDSVRSTWDGGVYLKRQSPSGFAFYSFSLNRSPEADSNECAGLQRQRGIVALEKR